MKGEFAFSSKPFAADFNSLFCGEPKRVKAGVEKCRAQFKFIPWMGRG